MTQQIQIGDIVRDMTADEIANHKMVIAEVVAEAEARVEAEATKATAREALLDKLGITADEAQLLLG